ncbi:hypothetical protein C8R43DRAFT_1086367 [Mycena crocata]|nr:hypothetical protein C8R43DRAFT_1086367 [Mycena crocata]
MFFCVPCVTYDALSLELSSAASSVNPVAYLTLTAAITNNGAEDIKVLKYGTILDADMPTRSFTVVPFTRIKLFVSLTDADHRAYTTIAAGETVTVAAPVAQKISARSELTTIEAASSPIIIAVTGDVANHELPAKRATDICTTASRKTFIDARYTEAKALASGGSSYITSRGSSNSLYTAYWGSLATSRITSVLNAVASESSSSRTLSCIYYCSIFFNEVATTNLCSGTTVASRNIRDGTTLHEIREGLTHAVADTDDVTYGCAADQALADANAVINADNYNCFTTQVYANTVC